MKGPVGESMKLYNTYFTLLFGVFATSGNELSKSDKPFDSSLRSVSLMDRPHVLRAIIVILLPYLLIIE